MVSCVRSVGSSIVAVFMVSPGSLAQCLASSQATGVTAIGANTEPPRRRLASGDSRTTWSTRAVTEAFNRYATQAAFMTIKRPSQTPAHRTRRCYLAEVRLRVVESELSWISQSLNAACLRLRGCNLRAEVLSAVYIPDRGSALMHREGRMRRGRSSLVWRCTASVGQNRRRDRRRALNPRTRERPNPDPTRAQPNARPLRGS